MILRKSRFELSVRTRSDPARLSDYVVANRPITETSLLANPSLILDRLCVGVLVMDMNAGLALYSNHELARILGCSRQDILKDNEIIWSLSNANDRVSYKASARRVVDREIDRFRLVCRFYRPDGREVCTKILANVLSRSGHSILLGLLFEELGSFNLSSQAINIGAVNASKAVDEIVDNERTEFIPRGEHAPMSKVFRFIEDNWNKRISVQQLSRLSGVSARTIHNYFAAENTTPNKYIKRLKLERSREMLQRSNGQTTVTAVAFKCGFSNVGHFARDYKQQFGEVPSETLKSCRESTADN